MPLTLKAILIIVDGFFYRLFEPRHEGEISLVSTPPRIPLG